MRVFGRVVRTCSAFAVLCLCVAAAAPAAATGLHICNRTSNLAWVAVAMEATWPLNPTDDAKNWAIGLSGFRKVVGWFKLAPGACTTPIPTDLNQSSSLGHEKFFFYAYDSTGLQWSTGSGSETFCVDRAKAFTYDTQTDMACAGGSSQSFVLVPIGPGYSDWTSTLTNTGGQ